MRLKIGGWQRKPNKRNLQNWKHLDWRKKRNKNVWMKNKLELWLRRKQRGLN